MPVGLWVMRTAESVVFTDWPPGPDDRYTSICRSSGRISTSTSSASGNTATVAVDVCSRPWDSVTGTRCTRWTPDSCFRRVYASLPRTSITASLSPPPSDSDVDRSSVFQRCRSA